MFNGNSECFNELVCIRCWKEFDVNTLLKRVRCEYVAEKSSMWFKKNPHIHIHLKYKYAIFVAIYSITNQYGCFESFPFRQNLLFSSARSRDFDGLIGIELPVSMYTTKTPIDLCRFNVRSSTLKNLNIFCKRQISIKLFYLYQRLQCRDKYFFKIKLVFFLYLRLSASSKENDLPLCMYFWYQTDSRVPNTSIYSAVSLASPYYNYL
jgi:hypothetical protein